MATERFSSDGPVALDPRASSLLFTVAPPRETATVDGVAVVYVTGPLSSRSGGWCDSYEAILGRVDAALASKPPAVCLSLDSPGGDAQGCIEASFALRARATQAGVPLYAYVERSACSAAYALACAADKIGLRPSAVVGSIGVMDSLVSEAAANAAAGLDVRLIATGARKTDGNPAAPISDAAVTARSEAASYLGGLFSMLVEERRGLSAPEIRALDGGIAIGANAVTKRLADTVANSLPDFLASIATPSAPAAIETPAAAKAKTMDEIKKALQAVIDDPNKSDEEKAMARAALAKLSPEPAATDSKPAPSASTDEDESSVAAKALAEVHKLRAEITRRDESAERASLLASRPDFAPELAKLLQVAPMAMVREMVSTLPRSTPSLAAAASVTATLGATQGSAQASRLSPTEKAALDAKMGMHSNHYGVIDAGDEQRFGAVVPAPSKKA